MRILVGGMLAWVGSAVIAAPLSVQVTDAQGKVLSGAVVAVERNGKPESAKPGTMAQMAQKDRQFQPQLLVIQTGTQVNFPNMDPVRHHVYSYSAAKSFELKLFLGPPAAPVLFDKPGVVTVGCNIHDRMAAQIVIVDSAQHALTDTQGRVQFDAPAGALVLKVWHPSRKDPQLFAQAVPSGADSVQVKLP